MDKLLVLMFMLFCHFVADYQVQGILANMKQKSWWIGSVPDLHKTKYKNDYKAALIAHSFEWSFIMMLPLFYEVYYGVYGFEYYSVVTVVTYIALLIGNTIAHYFVDNAKANKNSINLIEDQLLHLSQVIVTWVVFMSFTWRFFYY